MDRTVLYREIVRIALDGEPEEQPRVETVDDVTSEANSIAQSLARLQASLKQMRPRYLAISGLRQISEADKDDFDYLVREMLQREQRRVRALEKREKMRYDSSKPKGFASRWLSNPDAHGMNETLAKHRQGMFYYLNSQLQKISVTMAELQQIRSARSTLAKPVTHTEGPEDEPFEVPRQPSFEGAEQSMFGGNDGDALQQQQEQHLTTENEKDVSPPEPDFGGEANLQLLQEEHDALMEDLNATLEKAQRAEQSLREVADLQAELGQHLAIQTQQIDSLTVDAFRTTVDVEGANEQLERAKRSNRRASRFIIVSSLATGVFLLLLNGK